MKELLPARRLAPGPQLPPTTPAQFTNPASTPRSGPPRAHRTRGEMRSRHVEAHAVAWLRSLRSEAEVTS